MVSRFDQCRSKNVSRVAAFGNAIAADASQRLRSLVAGKNGGRAQRRPAIERATSDTAGIGEREDRT
jgi:hypothetical protein